MRQKYTLIIIFLLSIIEVFSCTIGIASHEISASNKPILWKSRDISPSTTNTIRYVENMTYKFVGISTPGEARVWMGVNEMGFAIANSLSDDLTVDTGVFYNGNLIYNALGLVEDLEDFEEYLDYLTTVSTIDLELRGNFVAFDAQGNSKLYEVNNSNYWVFDTDDTPNDYLLRTNHSVNGGGTEGIERLVRSTEIIEGLVSNNELTVPNLLMKQIRDVSDSQSQPFPLPWQFGDETPIFYTDYSICRRSTISAVVIEGVEEGEDPRLSTMWLIMGNPFVSYAIPLLPTVKPTLEQINNLSENSPELVSILWNSDNDYFLDTSHFVNSANFSLLQTFSDRETEVYDSMENMKIQWDNEEINDNDMRDFINLQASSTLNFSSELFYNFTPNSETEIEPIPTLSIYPSPFSKEVTIESLSSKSNSARVEIYNLKGQFVRSLENTNQKKYVWDGRDTNGQRMASGIYLVKYESKAEKIMQKLLFIK